MIRGGNQSSSSNSNCRTRKSKEKENRTNCDSGTVQSSIVINKEAAVLDEADQKRGCRGRSSKLMKKANPETHGNRGLQSMPTMTRSATI